MFNVELKRKEDIIIYAKKLQALGAQHVLVSMAGDGAILVTKDGKVYETMPPKGKVVNSVGAGDSMVAGFITGYLNTNDMEKAFRLGVAAGLRLQNYTKSKVFASMARQTPKSRSSVKWSI